MQNSQKCSCVLLQKVPERKRLFKSGILEYFCAKTVTKRNCAAFLSRLSKLKNRKAPVHGLSFRRDNLVMNIIFVNLVLIFSHSNGMALGLATLVSQPIDANEFDDSLI